MLSTSWEQSRELALIAPGAEKSLLKAKAEDRKHYYVEDVVYDSHDYMNSSLFLILSM